LYIIAIPIASVFRRLCFCIETHCDMMMTLQFTEASASFFAFLLFWLGHYVNLVKIVKCLHK